MHTNESHSSLKSSEQTVGIDTDGQPTLKTTLRWRLYI